MKRILLLILLSCFATNSWATQTSSCKIEGIAKLVKKTKYDGYWGLVYDVEVFSVLGTDDSKDEWCEKVVTSSRNRKGMFRVSTGMGGSAEPEVYSQERQWFIWETIDSGMYVGESFGPVPVVTGKP
jgi:hypothetical protein